MLNRDIKLDFVSFIKIFSILFLLSLISACGTIRGDISDQEIKDLETNMNVATRSTVYDPSIRNLGKMLDAYNCPVTPVQSQNIGNETADQSLPTDLYTMVATTLNKVGSKVIFIPYDAQYIIEELTIGGTINRVFPSIVLTGAVTGYNKSIIRKTRETQAEGGWDRAQGGGSFGGDGETSWLTLSLNMMDYKTLSYFQGVTTTNSIFIRKHGYNWSVFGSYMDFGLSVRSSFNYNQGLYASIRNIVELSVIEILGKYFEVPYWRVIPEAKEDIGLTSRVKSQFKSKYIEVQKVLIKQMLFLHGFKDVDFTKNELNPKETKLINSEMKKFDKKTYGDLYVELWKTVPLDTAIKQLNFAKEEIKKVQQHKNAKNLQNNSANNKKVAEKKNIKTGNNKKSA